MCFCEIIMKIVFTQHLRATAFVQIGQKDECVVGCVEFSKVHNKDFRKTSNDATQKHSANQSSVYNKYMYLSIHLNMY